MTNPDGNMVLWAIETLAHATDTDDDYRLKIIVRKAQDYIRDCGPLWEAWKRSQEEGA